MTDDAFEAFWFLYRSSQETLKQMVKEMVRRADKSEGQKSHITYFNEAIRSALNRANSTDEFVRAIEQSLDMRFYQSYGDSLPSPIAMKTLFAELKQHGTLAFMPRLVERVQKRKQTTDEQAAGGDE